MSEAKVCGTCTLCCELLVIKELDKPENRVCEHQNKAEGGCRIYGRHPASCQSFRCHWLTYPAFDDSWKPDACHFLIMQPTPQVLVACVDTDHPDAWRAEPYYSQLKQWSEATLTGRGAVLAYVGADVWAIFPEEDLLLQDKPEGALVEAGYIREGDLRRPAAMLKTADGGVRTVTGGLYRELQPGEPAGQTQDSL